MTNGTGGVPGEQEQGGGEAERLRPVAPVWHAIVLLVAIVGLSALQRPQALAQANIQPNRLATYLLTLIYELVLLGYVWLGLRLYKIPLREIIGGRWQTFRDFLRDVGIAILFWFAVAGMLIADSFLFHFSGVDAAVFAAKSEPRPGTKDESTAPGETVRTRTCGAIMRASDFPITSSPAFAAQ